MFRIPSKPISSNFKVRSAPAAPPPLEPIAVTPWQACQMLGVTRPTLAKWTRAGLIAHRRVGKRVLYSVDALKAFVNGEKDSPTAGKIADDSKGKLAGEPTTKKGG